MKKILFLFLWLSISLVGGALAQETALVKKIRVVTTLFPLYDFAKEVGKDKVDVTLILPPGVEPHTYEPTPADIVKIDGADVFIYTGDVMEPWVSRLLPALTRESMLILDASHGVLGAEDKGADPHIWLDFESDQKIADELAQAFADTDPEDRGFYYANAESYKAKLAALDQRYRKDLKGCRLKTIIYGGHFVFGRLARRYGLEYVVPYQNFSPDAEPSPRAVGELIWKMKTLGARQIFYEELIDPKVARVVSEETGAKMVLLHGAHNVSADERDRGITFLSIMQENLGKLKEGLQCP